MTAVEFAKEMDYDYSTVMRWLKDGIVPGAEFVPISGDFGVWQIPKSAITEIKLPRPGRKKARKKADEAEGASADGSLFETATTAKPARKARVKKTGAKKTTKKGGAGQ